MAKREVSGLQAPRQLRLHGAQFHGVAAGLKHRQDAATTGLRQAQPALESVQRRSDGRGVVGEVVINRDGMALTCHSTAHLHAAAYIFEAGQGQRRLRGRHAHVFSRRDGGQRVELVVGAGQRPFHTRHHLAALQHVKGMRFALRREVAHRCAKAAQFAPQPHVQDPVQRLLKPVGHHPARARHGAHQVVKLALNGAQVVKDVGVVEFQVVQNGSSGPVVHKLAAFVKKRGVVFVGLDHEHRRFGCGATVR